MSHKRPLLKPRTVPREAYPNYWAPNPGIMMSVLRLFCS